MKRDFRFIVCLLALAGIFLAAESAVTQAAEKEWKIPDEAKWFAGILEGEIISKNETEPSIVLKIKGISKTLEGNKAKKPDRLKGEKAVILTQMIFKEGRMTVDETLVKFIKEVKVGSKVDVAVKSDGLARLRMTEVPAFKKK